MRKNNKLEFSDFCNYAKKRWGLPSSKSVWNNYAKQGLVTFRHGNTRGDKVFTDFEEMDNIIRNYLAKIEKLFKKND